MPLISLIVLASCQEDIELHYNREADQRVVIEGRILDRMGTQIVRLTNSDDYYSNKVSAGALVEDVQIVAIGSGNIYSMSEVDTGNGYFMSKRDFAGVNGETYRLEFNYKNEQYAAEASLNAVTSLDSFNYVYIYYQEYKIGFYETYISFTDPPEPGNYYFYNVYLNDTLYNRIIAGSMFENDEIYNGYTLRNWRSYAFHQEEITQDTNKLRIEMLSISREEYNFINALIIETQANGSVFAGPPADVPSNIKNLTSENHGLGFFAASAISSKEITLIKQHNTSTNNPIFEN